MQSSTKWLIVIIENNSININLKLFIMRDCIIKFSKAVLAFVVLSICTVANAQIKYRSDGKLTN